MYTKTDKQEKETMLLMMMTPCCRERLINTRTLSESKLHSCHEVHSADSDRLSLSQKLQLDPKMADYVTERRQSASYRKKEVCTQPSLDLGNILIQWSNPCRSERLPAIWLHLASTCVNKV